MLHKTGHATRNAAPHTLILPQSGSLISLHCVKSALPLQVSIAVAVFVVVVVTALVIVLVLVLVLVVDVVILVVIVIVVVVVMVIVVVAVMVQVLVQVSLKDSFYSLQFPLPVAARICTLKLSSDMHS